MLVSLMGNRKLSLTVRRAGIYAFSPWGQLLIDRPRRAFVRPSSDSDMFHPCCIAAASLSLPRLHRANYILRGPRISTVAS